MSNPHGIDISSDVKRQIHTAIEEMMIDIPPYSVFGISVVVHDGQIKRIKTTKEIQMEINNEN